MDLCGHLRIRLSCHFNEHSLEAVNRYGLGVDAAGREPATGLEAFVRCAAKVTGVVVVEIRSSARWRALPPRHCSASHYAERRRDADPGSCRL